MRSKIVTDLFRILNYVAGFFARYIFSFFCKIDKSKIVFFTFQGDYTCDAKYICEYILMNNLPYKLVWVTKNENDNGQFPKKVKVVKCFTFKYYMEIASAYILIENSINIFWHHFFKKKKQVLIQTWHGTIGIKRIDESMKDAKINRSWIDHAKKEGNKTDICISGSSYETAKYQKTYWSRSHIIEKGHPRNTPLLKLNEQAYSDVKSRVCSQYGIPTSYKIILYAPTFRDDLNFNVYNLDYELITKTANNKFGGDWIVLLRYHNNLKNQKYFEVLNNNFTIDCSGYKDIQELLLISDIGITDYSSWIFDYLITERPGFIYAEDILTFEKSRGFTYPLHDLPFPISENSAALANCISNFDCEKFANDVKRFKESKGFCNNRSPSRDVVKILDGFARKGY